MKTPKTAATILMSMILLMSVIVACTPNTNSPTKDRAKQPSEETSVEEEPKPLVISEVLLKWQAGKTVAPQEIEVFGGVDNCFGVDTIPDDIWKRMQGRTYQDNPYIQRSVLRHIRALHWDYDNQIHLGEMVANKRIADTLAGILRKLYDAQYPIERMVLPDVYAGDDEAQMRDNNSSCFYYRNVAHGKKLSKHATGMAVDINTLYNPYYKDRADGTRFIQPSNAEPYCDRSQEFPYKIDHQDLCYRLFKEAGFRWGGDFRSCKDYQHFEFVE